jgi:hypothetical protein
MLQIDESRDGGNQSRSNVSPQQGLPADYALAALRCGALRARLMATEADTIGLGLRAGLISPEAALLWARDAGVLDLVSNEDIEAGAADIMVAAT